jgi:glyoxylase-like metal-dependent hydrolase (beta-lactamase superfamily II)
VTSARPSARPVADGVWGVRVPLVDSPVRSVLVYLVEHDDGFLLIDTGYGDEPGRAAITRALGELGAGWPDVTALCLTHNHPDHVGMANRVRDDGAWVALHHADMPGHAGRAGFVERIEHELELAAFPSDSRQEVFGRTTYLARTVDSLRVDRPLVAGEVIDEGGLALEVIATPGHTGGHVGFLDRARGVLFSGDLVLADGEVQLEVMGAAGEDPVTELRDSMLRVAALDVAVLLPGHQRLLTSPRGRLEAAIAEIDERRRLVATASGELPGASAWEVAARVDWGQPWATMRAFKRRFVVMQTYAHLRSLALTGGWRRVEGPPDRYWSSATVTEPGVGATDPSACQTGVSWSSI